MTPFSRRSFLAGAAASLTVPSLLSACGDSVSPSAKIELIRFNADGYFAPGSQRLPIGLADAKGAVITAGPTTLTGRVLDATGKVMSKDIVAQRRGEGMPRPFWPFVMSVAAPGQYQLQIETSSGKSAIFFTVSEPSKIPAPKPGDQLRFVDTATIANDRGVKPICTRNPFCPFHSVSLKDAQALHKPIAFLVSTPAHCTFAVCGPVLDFLIEEQKRFGDKLVAIHAEVYKDEGGTEPVDTMEAYGLTFEPCLFLADATGKVVERYDVLFDQKELGASLDKLVTG